MKKVPKKKFSLSFAMIFVYSRVSYTINIPLQISRRVPLKSVYTGTQFFQVLSNIFVNCKNRDS